MSILYNLNLKNQNRKLLYVLITLYGIGRSRGLKICTELGLDPNIYLRNVTEHDLNKINSIVSLKCKYDTDADLKKKKYDNIRLLKNIKSYRGLRHIYKLPANGQRTHTNAQTARWK